MTAYAVLGDIPIYGLNSAVIASVSDPDKQAILDAANDFADSYLGSRFKLPLTAWGKALTEKVCEIAAWKILTRRGYDPEDAPDAEVYQRYKEAIEWFKGISQGEITPVVTDSGGNSYGGPNTLQMSTNVQSTQPSASGALSITTDTHGVIQLVGAPRSRGWR